MSLNAVEKPQSRVVRFAGDSGDGIQLTGNQFTQTIALHGNDLSTFPDFPAEIRAPVGTTYGVSAYQINFGSNDISTPGDELDALVALNPAALTTNLADLRQGGLLIVDSGTFNEKNLVKAKYPANPLTDHSLDGFRLLSIDISKLTLDVVKPLGLSRKEGLRCKNFWALGLVLWLFSRDRKTVLRHIERKFAGNPILVESNAAALNAGHIYGETAELSETITAVDIPGAFKEAGTYRNVSGSQALAWGLVSGGYLSGLPVFMASYPITPASQLLHHLSRLHDYNAITFQAEDEIAAICAAIGSSFGGHLAVTSSSGPGIALKTEAMSLACCTELPLVIINTQRAGPSTGMPTKTEQADLLQAMYARHGDTPLPIIAPRSPSDCFDAAIEACRIATQYMTPVILLSDGYLANAMEPWSLPDINDYPPFTVSFHENSEGFHPYLRNPDTLARVWAKPGTPGLEHRLGGIEKDYDSGNISYDPLNHQKMTNTRWQKVLNVADSLPPQDVSLGSNTGRLAVVGWGSTYGAIHQAVQQCLQRGLDVAHIHLRHLWPMPRNLAELLNAYEHILVPEMNMGQLRVLLKSQFERAFIGLPKVTGQPFKISEIVGAIDRLLENRA